MLREEVLNSTRELVNQIYEKMNVIETCDSVAEKVKNLDVCFNDPDSKQVVALEGILSAGQLSTIRENIVNIIYSNATDAQSFLEKLNRKPAIVNPEFEAAVQDMVKSPEKNKPVEKPVPPEEPKPELTVELVKKMYLDEGKTLKEVADYFGVNKSMLNSYISRNKLNRTSYGKDDGFRDAEVEQRRKDPFLDANKMGKDEFKRQMLAGRK